MSFLKSLVLQSKKCAKTQCRHLGYDLRWLPRALRHRDEGDVHLTLEHIVARRMAQTDDFFFVQIGAFDGSCVDPVGEMARRHRWRGLLVEPQPEAFAALQKTYAGQTGLTFVQAAITQTCGMAKFYQVQSGAPELPDKAPLIASLDREMVIRNLGGRTELAVHIREISVPTLTLDALATAHGIRKIDLLQIDAEGSDFQILQSLDAASLRPAIINYEHALLSSKEREAAWEFLLARGYRLFVHEPDTAAVAD